mgnify:CR=1 FL=1
MADVPLPEPDGVIAAMWNVVRHGPNYDGRQNDVIAAAKAYAERHAAAVSAAKDAEIERLRAEVAGLRAWLEADARCPCCDTTDACLDGCTFATDCPQDAERMAEVRALLAARKGEA